VFHATSLSLTDVPGTLTGNCGDDPGIACRLTWDLSRSSAATQLVKVYLAGPISQAGRILFVLVLALFVRAIVNRVSLYRERGWKKLILESPRCGALRSCRVRK
jgi:hypothetical protein